MAWPDPHFLPGQAPGLAAFSSGSGAKDAGSLVSTALGALELMDPPKNWSHPQLWSFSGAQNPKVSQCLIS